MTGLRLEAVTMNTDVKTSREWYLERIRLIESYYRDPVNLVIGHDEGAKLLAWALKLGGTAIRKPSPQLGDGFFSYGIGPIPIKKQWK